MRVLVTGAGGQLGRIWWPRWPAGCRWRPAPGPGRPAGPRSGGRRDRGRPRAGWPSSDRAAVLAAVDEAAARRDRPRRGLDGGRRLRGRSRAGLRGQRPGDPARGRGGPAAPGPPGLPVDRLRLRRHVDRPYVEWDAPNPLSVYGRSKLGGEQECPAGSTIVRTSWVCGAHGANMVGPSCAWPTAAGATALRRRPARARPPSPPTWPAAVVTLATDRLPGHLPRDQPGRHHVVRLGPGGAGGGRPGTRPGCEPITTADLDPPRPAPRPANSVLDNAALRLAGLPLLPEWQRRPGAAGGRPAAGRSR